MGPHSLAVDTASSTTVSGYAPPTHASSPSAAAEAVRSAAVLSSLSSCELPRKSRAIFDQHELPCCVSCAVAAAREVLEPSVPQLSPLFHYHVTRYEQDGADADGSLVLPDALSTLSQQGICSLRLHRPPYSEAGAQTVPSQGAYTDALSWALKRRGLRSRFQPAAGPSTVAWMREQLQLGRPVVLGFTLPAGYPATFLDSRFTWQNPAVPASSSGHCVLVVGYSDVRQLLRIQDSRGEASFDGGCWWMSYRVADSAVVKEAYSLLP
jgi:hypothetical protein